ncbi:MAG: hypothetical protein RQ735_11785 [Flavobacteriaceae bacterium]|nr:hypothetical protein [Flavobacteriaceae bacterium]
MKTLIAITLLALSINVSSQKLISNDSIFVLIDDDQHQNLFRFEKNKNNEFAKIKILHFNSRNKGFYQNENGKSNKEIIIVEPQPNNVNYYEFTSIKPPINVSSIKNYITFSILELSKNSAEIWKKHPYTLFFIEKSDCNSYNIWEMALTFQE